MKKFIFSLILVLFIIPTQTQALPNPAAEECNKAGYKNITIDTALGQSGLCEFDDGSVCEGFSWLRGECKIGECKDFIRKYDCSKGPRCNDRQEFLSYLDEYGTGDMIFTDEEVLENLYPKLPKNPYGWISNCCTKLPTECVPMANNQNKSNMYIILGGVIILTSILIIIIIYLVLKRK